MSAATPWAVIQSPSDPEMSAVHGCYLVADNLPIEDAHLIAAAPRMLGALIEASKVFRKYEALHNAKGTVDGAQKAAANGYMANLCEAAIAEAQVQA